MVTELISPPTVPTVVSAIFMAWSEYKAAVAAFNANMDALSLREKAARGDVSENIGSVVGDSSRISADETAKYTRGALVKAATQLFAPAGARLDIPEPPFDGKQRRDTSHYASQADASEFDAEAVWAFLVQNYGGQSGVAKAYADIAKKLSSALRLQHDTDIKMVGGRAVLAVTTYPDKTFGDIIGYRDRETLLEVLDGFVAVAQWSGLWDGVEYLAVNDAREDVNLASRKKILPERRLLGDSVLIVPFKSKWEYRLSQAFAEKLNLFVSEFHFSRSRA